MSGDALPGAQADRLEWRRAMLNHSGEAYQISKEIVRLRTADGNPDKLFDARLNHVFECGFSGNDVEQLTEFAWCLARYEAEPDKYRWHTDTFLRAFTNIMSDFPDFPQFSREQIAGMLERVAAIVGRVGRGERGVALLRFKMAWAVGDLEQAELWIKKHRRSRRDFIMRCEACEKNDMACYLASVGKHARAVKEAEPLLQRRLVCHSVPTTTFSDILRSLALLERYEEADQYQKQGYRLIRKDQTHVRQFAAQMAYHTHRGKPAEALKLIDRHAAAAFASQTPVDRLHFSWASAGALEKAAKKKATVKLTLPATCPARNDDGVYDPRTLAAWFEQDAAAIAARFDARNGNDYISRLEKASLQY